MMSTTSASPHAEGSRRMIHTGIRKTIERLSDEERHNDRVQNIVYEIDDYEQRLISLMHEHERLRLLSAINHSLESYMLLFMIVLFFLGLIGILNEAFYTIVFYGVPLLTIGFLLYRLYIYLKNNRQRRRLLRRYQHLIRQKHGELEGILIQIRGHA